MCAMTPRRGHRRKMAGRGAGQPPSPSRASPETLPKASVDFFAQARKALSLRAPFEAEEAAPRSPSLPAGLATFLARQTDGRKKHKKAPEDSEEKPERVPAAPSTVWEQTEEYFRPVTLDDIDALVQSLPFSSGRLDSCFLIPVLGSAAERDGKDGPSHALEVELTLRPALDEGRPAEAEQSIDTEKAENLVEQQMEIDGVDRNGKTEPELEKDGSLSLNWLLGAKERFVLTSERPNKKRKLLGGDAGLEHLLVLPHPQTEAGSSCDLCCYSDSGSKSNRLLCCESCKVLVHQRCYGVHEMPEALWLCSWCRHSEGRSSNIDGHDPGSRPCLLCSKGGGALKPVARVASRSVEGSGLKFAHLFCCLWIPEVYVEDIHAMEPVMNIRGIQETRKKLVCSVCKVKQGACVRCSHGTCRTSFHPICARESKHQMEIWGKFGNDNVEMRAFCSKHSMLHDMNIVQNNHRVTPVDAFLEVGPPSAAPVIRRTPKLKLTRTTKDRSMVHELTGSSSDHSNNLETSSEEEPLSCVLGSEGQTKEIDIGNNIEQGSLTRNSPDFAVILKRLIDRGKINVDNLASEMGISSDSLQAALVGETTTFSPGLKLKIIKWLQNSVHMASVQPKMVRDSSVILSNNISEKVDGSEGHKVKGAYDSSDNKGAALDVPDPVVKSLLARRRTKVPQVGDSKGETNGELSSLGCQDYEKEEELPQVVRLLEHFLLLAE